LEVDEPGPEIVLDGSGIFQPKDENIPLANVIKLFYVSLMICTITDLLPNEFTKFYSCKCTFYSFKRHKNKTIATVKLGKICKVSKVGEGNKSCKSCMKPIISHDVR
jgi:hypothetical protein